MENEEKEELVDSVFSLLASQIPSPCERPSLPRETSPTKLNSRFLQPTTDEHVKKMQESCVPQTTEKSTKWAVHLWEAWNENRKQLGADSPCCLPHLLSFENLNKWMCKFILEVRRKDGNEYPPSTLYQISCGIMRHIRKYCPELNFFTQVYYIGFKQTLDGEMRRLKACGAGAQVKRAKPLDVSDEEKLWEKGLLGWTSPQTLLDTILFMCGMYFALRSGQEHRVLQLQQINITVKNGHRCLIYTENSSKNNPGGIKNQKVEPKIVTQYANIDNPSRCFVKTFEVYIDHCPKPRKSDALYLTPLKKPKDNVWFSSIPVGHNTLSKTINRICSEAGIDGFITNHSLRVTAATRLFQAGVDEQLIMRRTGHRSIDGVRLYKRISIDQEKEVSLILNSGGTRTPSDMEPASLKKPKIPSMQDGDSDDAKFEFSLNINNCPNVNITIQK